MKWVSFLKILLQEPNGNSKINLRVTNVNDYSLIEKITNLIGSKNLLLDETSLAKNSIDAFGRFRNNPDSSKNAKVLAVVTPSTTQQIANIIKLANNENVAVVPHGGGTGVMGAITPMQDCLSIDLRNMNKVLNISYEDRTATVGAGIILADLEFSLNEQGLILGHDPYSVPIATVGGAISTNGVGYRATRYGSMGDQVLGLEVVLPNGKILKTPAVVKSSTGPSLNQLFIGAEGSFGIITQATLRVFKSPERRVFKSFIFNNFEDGFKAMAEMFSLGIKPALIDVSEEIPNPSSESTTVMYLTFEGYIEEVEAQLARTITICNNRSGKDSGESLAKHYWDTRHDSAYSYKEQFLSNPPQEPLNAEPRRLSEYPHVSIPISKVLDYRSKCEEIVGQRNMHIREYSCWTAPELFSMILVNIDMANDSAKSDRESMSDVVTEILSIAQNLGGSMEYVHGVGTKLAHLMPQELGNGLDLLREIKYSLDPNNIMNPGRLGL